MPRASLAFSSATVHKHAPTSSQKALASEKTTVPLQNPGPNGELSPHTVVLPYSPAFVHPSSSQVDSDTMLKTVGDFEGAGAGTTTTGMGVGAFVGTGTGGVGAFVGGC